MADTAVLLNISEMIDLAIGSPEVGVVDFNMLQTVLHCLAQQLRVLGKNVEMRGSLVSVQFPRENAQTIAIKEYAVDTDNTTKLDIAAPPPPPAEETILVVERIKKTDSPSGPSPVRAASPSAHGKKAAGRQTPLAAPVSSTERLSLVTTSKFNVLENTVEDLKNRVYGTMPKNEEILEGVRSQTNVKAISDMWTNLNVSSRLEATEAGIAKLSSLVQDFINEMSPPQAKSQLSQKLAAISAASQPAIATGGASARVIESGTVAAPGAGSVSGTVAAPGAGSVSGTVAAPGAGSVSGTVAAPGAGSVSGTVAAPGAGSVSGTVAAPGVGSVSGTVGAPGAGSVSGTVASPAVPASVTDLARVQGLVDDLRVNLDHLTQTFYDAIKEINPIINLPPPPVSTPSIYTSAIIADHGPSVVGMLPPAGEAGARGAGVSGADIQGHPEYKHRHGADGLHERVSNLEKRLKECCDKIGQNDNLLRDQITSFQDQLDYVVKQLASLSGGGAGGVAPDLVKELQGLMQLFQTVQEMQEQLKKVHETALQLAAEKEDRQSHVNALLEQIELLKNIKLDREDMVEAMAEKADLRMLARKVSHDQFEMACDGLSRGLEHALGKLNMQESLWQQALDDIQREIETKLDKMELSPVKDFFNDKLKQLQENLKQMASLRREAEAAGTKRKLLRDVNCISCDANAVMSMDQPTAMPVSKPLPAMLSMKPYLSYELDTIRKTQASNLQQRNMHDWENIDKQMGQPSKPTKVRSEADKHMCNRYCGGSHTTTTPSQRVARLGHFIKQWGPDVLPLSSGLAAGDDGRMYRVTPAVEGTDGVGSAGAAVDTTCTPKSPSKPELPRLPEKPSIVAECKCLEAPGRTSGSR